MTLTHTVVTQGIKGLVRIMCRVDAAQLAKVPEEGPLIVVANHVNFVEAPIVYTHLCPRSMTTLAKAETWDSPGLRLLANLWGAIPIQRGEVDRTALRMALQALDEGKILILTPEGTRSGHGRLQQGMPGTVLLALRSGVPLMPLVFYGGEVIWSNLRRLRRTDFHIVVGEPFYLDADGVRVTRDVRQQMTDELMYQMAALLPPAYRGVYSDLAAATEAYLRFPPGSGGNLDRA